MGSERRPPAGGDRRATAANPPDSRLPEERVGELLDIAADIFIARGFEKASVGDIAREAGASKGTFYSRFPTKEELFVAVIEHRLDRVFAAVSDSLPPERPVEETLRGYGATLYRQLSDRRQVEIIRAVSAESRRFPQLARALYSLGPQRGIATLARYLGAKVASGELVDRPPEAMAEFFISSVSGGALLWYALGIREKKLGADEQRRHLETAIEAFLALYGS